MTKILLVGCGTMGGALRHGWFYHSVGSLTVVSPSAADAFHHPSELPPAYQPDVIIFAVKPQIIQEIMPLYQHLAQGDVLILSIAAGTSIGNIQRGMGSLRVVRAMPNLPVTVNRGMTGLCAGFTLSQEERSLVESLFKAVGDVVWVDSEDQIDAVTALSGSGPAYFYHFVELLAKAGEAAGLDRAVSEKLALSTFLGAAELIKSEGVTPQVLRERVTSKGGTTAAALQAFDQNNFGDVIERAIRAAYARAKELSI